MIMGTRALFRKRRGWEVSKKLGFCHAGGKRQSGEEIRFRRKRFSELLGVDLPMSSAWRVLRFNWLLSTAAGAQLDHAIMIIL